MMNNKAESVEMRQMAIDRDILRYLIIDSKMVHSTALPEKDDLAQYIYVKPGMFEDVMEISNIDAVLAIYATYGINLKKHKSHMHNKEVDVLFISVSDIMTMNDTQRKFLSDTAPAIRFGVDANSRITQIINQIWHQNQVKGK